MALGDVDDSSSEPAVAAGAAVTGMLVGAPLIVQSRGRIGSLVALGTNYCRSNLCCYCYGHIKLLRRQKKENSLNVLLKYRLYHSFTPVVLLLLFSCKIGEDYVREDQYLPQTYLQNSKTENSIAAIKWWELFKDPVLIQLIDTALIENRNIKIAVTRLEEAQIYFDLSKVGFYPSVNYYGGASSGINSETSDFSNNVS